MSLPFSFLSIAALVLALCPPLAAMAQDRAAPADGIDAHYQLTYIWQAKPGFNAAYSGANSLSTEREVGSTFSATAYFGLRPWLGGELFFNPEVTQGHAFSNLTGLGGFPNGELSRAATPYPQWYRQRLFLRQTWNQGGGSQALESDINQLSGMVEQNRVVLTVGNFSTLDVFDNNAFAKDPRRQFMNWGAMTYAAYDYAADARGFGWGAALEWYRGDWVYRLGRMTGPVTPNDYPVDFDILNHYGDQLEVERAHEWAGQPGKIRILAWRNRAVLARYRDAINQGQASGQTPDILKVRNTEQFKYGLGINLEQSLSSELGVFLRAMQADGATESYAFTDVDQSLAVGAVWKGSAWGRSPDRVGLSLMQNDLSSDHREYLGAGGLSFFIGDGRLSYQSETIVELYYSLQLAANSFVSFDFQRIHNPAYNADRGPVNFGAVRFHTEF
jgi:high affinity Mn2+ porin